MFAEREAALGPQIAPLVGQTFGNDVEFKTAIQDALGMETATEFRGRAAHAGHRHQPDADFDRHSGLCGGLCDLARAGDVGAVLRALPRPHPRHRDLVRRALSTRRSALACSRSSRSSSPRWAQRTTFAIFGVIAGRRPRVRPHGRARDEGQVARRTGGPTGACARGPAGLARQSSLWRQRLLCPLASCSREDFRFPSLDPMSPFRSAALLCALSRARRVHLTRRRQRPLAKLRPRPVQTPGAENGRGPRQR